MSERAYARTSHDQPDMLLYCLSERTIKSFYSFSKNNNEMFLFSVCFVHIPFDFTVYSTDHCVVKMKIFVSCAMCAHCS